MPGVSGSHVSLGAAPGLHRLPWFPVRVPPGLPWALQPRPLARSTRSACTTHCLFGLNTKGETPHVFLLFLEPDYERNDKD